MTMRRGSAVLLALVMAVATLASVRHPANVPTARVSLAEDGKVTVRVRFDILAYCLDATPTNAADGPLNALLEGSARQLQSRLDDANRRFRGSFRLTADNGAVTVVKLSFPTALEVLNRAKEKGKHRLPVMVTVVLSGTLPENAKSISCRFPEVLDAVIVTAEMPYREPVSERLVSGSNSSLWRIPTAAEIAKAKQGAARLNDNNR
jgi:hypothetical protein